MDKERYRFHFEPKKGWMNDPNGLIFYKGKYHAFFQHNPYAAKWDKMHWGHAVSNDMINWEELDIALFPDKEYEDEGGCFSGSAIEKDGRLYLFYTSVSKHLGQTQSVAYSDDGIHFEKYENNPVIDHFPEDGSIDFRDPKVIKFNDYFIMVLGSCKDNHGRVLFYKSFDLLNWEYQGILYEPKDYSLPIECPDLFPLGDKYVLMYSQIGKPLNATKFLLGSFDGHSFTEEKSFSPEIGPQFYAPQTFLAPDNRRILIGWFYDWKFKTDEDATFAGALTLPRELSLANGELVSRPISEGLEFEKADDERVILSKESVLIKDTTAGDIEVFFDKKAKEHSVKIYRDVFGLEVFINDGKDVVSVIDK